MKKKYKSKSKPNSYKVIEDGLISKLLINGKVVRTGDRETIKSIREYAVRHNLTKIPLGM